MENKDMVIANRKKEMSLLGLFGSETILSLQKRIVNVTDFSFSTIDYRGECVVKAYLQENYKEYIRYSNNHVSCQMTEAFASARAAIHNTPYIFECKCGLVKIAIPVIVNQQYLGAFICGGVRCSNIDALDPISGQPIIQRDFKESSKDYSSDSRYQKIPEYSASRIKAVAELVFYITCEMCEKENYAMRLGNSEHYAVHLGDLRRKNSELRKEIKKLELQNMRSMIQPQMLLNMLVTLSNSSIIENAKTTQKLIEILAPFLRYYLEDGRKSIPLEQEIQQIEQYMEIIKLQYRDRVDIQVHKNELDALQIVPKQMLYPLTEYIVNFGILNKNARGVFQLMTEYSVDRCVIFLKYEHTDDYINGMGYLKESGNVMDERIFLEQLNQLEKRINYEYDGDYKLTIDTDLIIVDLPKTTAVN